MRITCDTKDTLPLSALTAFQGGLKKRTADDTKKMTREEELKGLESVCSFLGSMSDDERFEYLLKNSNSLQKEMKSIVEKNLTITTEYVSYLEAAAKNLLLRICSTYGEMTAESVNDFLNGLEINFEEIKLPDGLLDLSAVLQDDDTKNDDDAPAAREDEPAQSKAGEIYELGEHRLICGGKDRAHR